MENCLAFMMFLIQVLFCVLAVGMFSIFLSVSDKLCVHAETLIYLLEVKHPYVSVMSVSKFMC